MTAPLQLFRDSRPIPQIALTVYKKEARSYSCVLRDRATHEGVPLTGLTLRFSVREDIDDAATVLTASTGSGITHGNQTTDPGSFTLSLTTDDLDLEVTEHTWDLWLDDEVIVPPSPFHVALSVRQPT
jgi:hypothetical protein